ncbi:NADH dehydrogenase subunit G [Shewanella psychrophila]|uniref:NADH-quinone oxidoreductase n=1 Tax=Shewanella psychrophila TaxID=225848 RepID=A0A1S6HTB4_9GAMM|nr:NADH-quinone oxidoreductase subunit NuoG [Shewanella psychrophila]AQS38678.1 NADH dehydrogenase subunit G [Shewanella psychrophila]
MNNLTTETDLVSIIIDNKAYHVAPNENLLQTCLTLGLDLPYFCWHSELGSVGACRQCAVKQYQNDEDKLGRLVMACMTPVSDGMIISMQDTQSTTFRQTNIEAIMTQHPHDCPVCEEGGNCHLQDMTAISGHINRRYTGKKRTHLNQYLGPMLNHEMNRCIGCYRCVRFYRDYCGGDDFNVFGSKSHLYFGRAASGALKNNFSGNLAEVCPTGVFTDKPFSEHYIRKWDLQTAPTICPHCSLGCNITVSERDQKVRRITNRRHDEINGHFLCNLGLFGYEHANHSERLDAPLMRNNAVKCSVALPTGDAKKQLAKLLSPERINTQTLPKCIAIGSARTHLENNAALMKLVGQDNFYLGVPDHEVQMLHMLCSAYKNNRVSPFSIKQAQACGAALIINEDISHTAPRLALAIRQMSRNLGIKNAEKLGLADWQDGPVRNIAQNNRSPLAIIASDTCQLSALATEKIITSPDEQVILIQEIQSLLSRKVDETKSLNDTSENVEGISKILDVSIPNLDKNIQAHPNTAPYSASAQGIVDALMSVDCPIIIAGLQSQDPALLDASLNIASLLKQLKPKAGFYGVTKQVNDLHFGLLIKEDEDKYQGIDSFIDRIIGQEGGDSPHKTPDTLIILETDLYRYVEAKRLETLFDTVDNIIVIDQLLTPTAQMADLLLPASSFAESQGCYLSSEGRLQHGFATISAINQRMMPWVWLAELTDLHNPAQLHHWLSQQIPILAPIESFSNLAHINLGSQFRIAGQPRRASARTAIHAVSDVKEQMPISESDTPFVQTMEGVEGFRQTQVQMITVLPANAWSPKWNSDQGANRSGKTSNKSHSPWILGIKIFSHASLTSKQNSQSDIEQINDKEPIKPKPNQGIDSNPEITSAGVRLVPSANLYADFELTRYSSSIQFMSPESNLKVHPSLAASLKLTEGQEALIQGEHSAARLMCKLDKNMSPDVALVPNPLFTLLGQRAKIISLKKKGEHDDAL